MRAYLILFGLLIAGGVAYFTLSTRAPTAPGSVSATSGAQPAAPDLTAYAIGYSLGERVRTGIEQDGVSAPHEDILEGFRAALADEEPSIDAEALEDELFRVQDELQRRLVEEALERSPEFRALAEEKLAASRAFLDENGRREGVQTGPRGGQWEVLVEGGGRSPEVEDTVEVSFVTMLVDGTRIEQAESRLVELDETIEGVRDLLTQMTVGAQWRVFVPPELGYGVGGRPPAVGPNEVIVLEVELVRIVE